MKNLFQAEAANENNPKWDNIISRRTNLYRKDSEIRSEFERDYTRIVNTRAYRRLKHKTQVFFSPNNDHICTRMEHANLVESISYTIAKYFGLNTELTKSIAIAHDLGHSPFGHSGERILSNFCLNDLGYKFWHEKNGLDLVDNIELLTDYNNCKQNLNLTYGVRDGIISHCGEIDENSLRPREEFIDLSDYTSPNMYSPYTWEACVVKISDKLSYLARDLEDAISFKILDNKLDELLKLLQTHIDIEKINNTILLNYFIGDLFKNSSLEKGLCFSSQANNIMNIIKKFNYENIYLSKRIEPSTRYFKLVLTEIYDVLKNSYSSNLEDSLNNLSTFCPTLYSSFKDFIYTYYDSDYRENMNLKNNIIFFTHTKENYIKAILHYISGMTDKFAIDIYTEIIGF